MKIAVFIYSLAGGGAERVVSQLLPYLENKGLEVFLVLMNERIDYNVKAKKKPYFIENSNTNESGFFKLIKIPILAYKYHLFLKRNGIEKSIAFLTRPSFISVLTKLFNNKRRIIISERSNPSSQYGYRDLQSKVNSFLIKKVYPKADLIISNSKGNADDLIRNFKISDELIETIYNPLDFDNISLVKPIGGFFDKSYFNLISVGRLDLGKNHSFLIKSISKLGSKKVRLYIFGTGDLFDKLKDLISELHLEDNVFLMGFDSNPYKYLKEADLFVFGSNHEGFPNVLLEAMACNLPIVTTNCPSGPNEILEAPIDFSYSENYISNYGILVPLNDENRMCDAINFMMENKIYYNKCKNELHKRLLDFDRNRILDKYYQLLTSL